MGDQFIVALGYAKDFIDGLCPGSWERFGVDDRSENGPEGLSEAENAKQDGIDGLRFRDKKGAETGSAVFGNKASIKEKRDKFIPRKIVSCRREIRKIESEPASNEMGSGNGHQITGKWHSMRL
jgi:hypothetical protein